MDDSVVNRAAAIKLHNELKELSRTTSSAFSVGLIDEDNLFEWGVTMFGPPDTAYEGGLFKARMVFPKNYPFEPPTLTFESDMWHPNVYSDGRVCISILHNSGEDPHGYEESCERWNPTQTVETILLSVHAMLGHPNDESPANVDAAKMFRESPTDYRRKVQRCVERSMENF
ncbi:hypothetical protein GGI04_001029 [Coemansia thaxteri]|uniref:UBC core domain-containing protein n=1 Tax=Coemansia thaxteri TaxID=2663907 RepID=A0A9W8ELR3_9FUNG|nr:hypothetical protein H4R26_000073 [Coemansia thaxteri]KAJ2008755.1 hypothetical protein GGI04_001029 [Coemansia thaxteri]KAJ2472230.1 hypothetical protein GGI02_001734 [Coemansia sp. RSA 2322]KAJ2488154.1 hypothetical protein EV174_000119 [Coemansia sp. RSA 2320]